MGVRAAISTWEEVGLAAVEGVEVGLAVADCRQTLLRFGMSSSKRCRQHAVQQLGRLRKLLAPGSMGRTAEADGSQGKPVQQSAPGRRWAGRRWRAWRWARRWRTAGNKATGSGCEAYDSTNCKCG